MTARGEVLLQVRFGPSKSPIASPAATYAREHAEEATEVGTGVWRASFRLGSDERTYGEASQLLAMVAGWRSTTVEVDGSPEPVWVAQQMLWCAREWLRATGACRESFFPLPTGWPKCRSCPLYDAEWATESGATPRWGVPLDPETGYVLEVPDHLPEEWEEG
jgi:hypothetical protein